MSTLLSLYDGSLKLTRFSLRSPLHRSSPQQSACSCHPVAILIIAAFFKQFLFVKNFSFDFENYSLHSLVPILLKIQIIIKKIYETVAHGGSCIQVLNILSCGCAEYFLRFIYKLLSYLS